MSSERKFHRRLPDLRVSTTSGRHHELNGFRQVGHVLFRVQGAVGSNPKLRVAALERDLFVQVTRLEVHCNKDGERT